MMDTLLLLALNGLIWGLIIALIALGLSVIFGLLDVINIAHGDFFMLKAKDDEFHREFIKRMGIDDVHAREIGGTRVMDKSHAAANSPGRVIGRDRKSVV